MTVNYPYRAYERVGRWHKGNVVGWSNAIDAYVAHLPGVKAAVRAEALQAMTRAKALLAKHRYQGHAKIGMSFGKTDAYVYLSDERGQHAAWNIEAGREGYGVEIYNHKTGETYTVFRGAMEGTWILHDAFNLPHRPDVGTPEVM